jgi:DNA-binding transcriptional regulator YhcF (GntR family)
VRKFLKKLGVTAQREIEKTVCEAVATGRLKDGDKLPAIAASTARI